MKTISLPTRKLIDDYRSWYQGLQGTEAVSFIRVDEIASRVAAFYERIKGVVDWQEEHLLRKRAIERTFKRKVILGEKEKEMGESLVYELIRGGHFPNNAIPESKTKRVQEIVEKYLFILKNAPFRKEEEKTRLQDWLLEIAAYEIEKTLSSFLKEESLIDYMTQFMQKRIRVKEGIITIKAMTEEEKNIQIYIGVQRALFKMDEAAIGCNLMERRYPDWPKLLFSSPSLAEISSNIYLVKKRIETYLNHPLKDKFYVICEKYDTPFLILGDIIAEDPNKAGENLENPEFLESLIKQAYSKRFFKLRGRTRRAACYSTLSIFVTKIALALAVEVPIDKYLTYEFSYPVLWINILFPPFLMFLLVATIKPPGKENLQRVIMEIMKLVYPYEKEPVYEIKVPKRAGPVVKGVILLAYSLTFILCFGAIIWVLNELRFGVLSMAIFIFFISVIGFFGMRIRERNKELVMEEKKETLLRSLLEFLCLPIIRLGKYFSAKWANLNVALIITILIDMPFLSFVKFLEQWHFFLKEKREEIH